MAAHSPSTVTVAKNYVASEPPPESTQQEWRGRHGVRAVSMLTVYLVLLLGIPSAAAITALGSLGRPAMLWGVVMLVWWVIAKLQTRVIDLHPVRQPVRFAYLVFFIIALISFAVAMMRGQPDRPGQPGVHRPRSIAVVDRCTSDHHRWDPDEERSRGNCATHRHRSGLAGRVRHRTIHHEESLIDFFGSIPGMTLPYVDIAERGGVSRVPGLAIHPLEYATILNAALPLVIAVAVSHGLRWPLKKGKIGWWIPVVLISLSALIGVSRSAIIGFAVAALTMIPVLPRRYRGVVIVGGIGLAAAAVVAIPGLLSTTLNLFAGASSDPSTQSRASGLALAPQFIAASPLVGAGFGTFLPRYYIFDNQWVLIAIELGVLGVIAFAAVFVSAIWSGMTTRKNSTDPGLRLLGYALAASVVNIAVLFAFFDGLSFPQSGGMFVLIVGLCGAIRAIGATDAAQAAPPNPLT